MRDNEKSGLQFLVKLNTASSDLGPAVETALNAAEKVIGRFPEAGITIELDIRLL